jgi:AcrR family transcriptional regulator
VSQRIHTGRRRNEAARQAILQAAEELLATGEGALITVAGITQRAGVGKQTIYRWWPSKSAVLLEAMIERAKAVAPVRDTGDLRDDLYLLLRSTFTALPQNRSLLLGVLHEGLADPDTMSQLAAFAASRRDALAQILDVAQRRGQIPRSAATELAVDQVFGVLWYRMIFGHQPLDARTARQLAEAVVTQLTTAPGVAD